MAFLRKHHLPVAALLFALAALLYFFGNPTFALAPLIAAVLVEGLAWVVIIDGASRKGAGEGRVE